MSYQGILSGLEDDQLIPASELIKAYLPEQQRRPEWRLRRNIATAYGMLAASCILLRFISVPYAPGNYGHIGWVVPIVMVFAIAAFPILWLLSRPKTAALPFDMPIQANREDPGNVGPNGKRAWSAGAFFLGIERRFGKQVWLATNKLTQHFLIPGTTGSGKTSMILGLIANSLSHGSGFFGIDAKSDLKFYHQLLALARIFNREADVRVLNMLNSDPYVSESFNSNTFNMLSMAPADDISSLISSLKSNMGKDNQTFESRSNALVSAAVRALVWLRDNLDISLSIVNLRDSIMGIDALIRLALGCDENGVEYPLTPEFAEVTEGIWSYLETFVSRQDVMAHAQETMSINTTVLQWLSRTNRNLSAKKYEPTSLDELKKQHGFATMALTAAFQNMIGDYKRIFGCSFGDVTLDDAIKNRRIVIALLPSLGKSRQDTISASKILVSNIRGMASRALGTKTFGNMRALLDSAISNASSPHLLIFEEAGPYVQDGMDQLYQQARGLNFCIATCFQDVPGLERNDQAVARSIIGNANYAFFMRLQDPTFTGKLAKEMGEQEYTSLVRSFEERSAVLTEKRRVDSKTFSIDKIDRITFRDLQSQMVGQATLIAEGKVVRMNAFYCEPLSCVPTHRVQSKVLRFGAWPLPRLSDISLVDLTKPKPAPQKAPSSRQHQSSDAAPDRQAVGSSGPAPAAPAALTAPSAQHTGHAPAPRFEEVSLTSFHDDALEQSTDFDPYNRQYAELRSSLAHRADADEVEADMYRRRAEAHGIQNVWDEFVAMSYAGIELVGRPGTTMDMGTMTIGLIALAGIRGRFRLEGKLPPYIPNSWTSNRPISDIDAELDWMDDMTDDSRAPDDLLAKAGPPLQPGQEMPHARFFDTHRPETGLEIPSSAALDFDENEVPDDSASPGDEVLRQLQQKSK